MTLIEVLITYQELFRAAGKDAANRWLQDTCGEHIWGDIESTFNEDGEFITAFGEVLSFGETQ